MEYKHISVLLMESIENLAIKPDGIYVDATLGAAGHSKEICKRLGPSGKLVGIDQDLNAHAKAKEVLADEMGKVILVHNNFSNISEVLKNLGIDKIDGFLMDLGVSSHQLDEADRGFSYMNDAPLDMRMDRQSEISAFDVVNKYSAKRLNEIIKDYGEERWSLRIAAFIEAQRKEKPIETTFELVSVIKKAVPKGARADGPHPAKRTFQAIRIEVNKELEILQKTIEDVTAHLRPSGRICAITFHSLEDRIVKNAFRDLAEPCKCPKEFPVCVCNRKPELKVITRKPILPSEEELEFNHRARSAKLRVSEKI